MKMTKLELRSQQMRLKSLLKYLPTLQLKKGLLQVELQAARQTADHVEKLLSLETRRCEEFAPLLSEPLQIDLQQMVAIKQLFLGHENHAGIELPIFEKVEFNEIDYALEETPVWLDGVLIALRGLKRLKIEREISQKRVEKLEQELREITTRVNLFEKILIPRTEKAIRKISVFLSDLQLSAVARAKVAKSKIQARKNAS